MAERKDGSPKTLGDVAVDLVGQMGAMVVKQSFDSGQYITMYGDVNRMFNKWGMDWPVGRLDAQTTERYVRDSNIRPLREIVAKHIFKEAEELWSEKRPEGYGTEPNFKRTIPDLAINEGYLKAAESILYPDVYLTGGTVADSSLEIDPTGTDWLNKKLNDLALVWNDIHETNPEFDTPEDPAVMGFRAGIERYEDLYGELVRNGAKKDEAKNKVLQVTRKIKRSVVNQVQAGGFKILESISNTLKKKS